MNKKFVYVITSILVLFAIIIIYINFFKPKVSDEPLTQQSKEVAFIPNDSILVLQKFFNTYNEKSKEFSFKKSPYKELIFDGPSEYFTKILLTKYYVEDSIHKHLIVTFTRSAADCHACGGILSGFKYALTDTGWVLENKKLMTGEAGQWGDFAGEISWLQVGKDKEAFMIKEGGSGQGYSSAGVAIYGIDENFNKILEDPDLEGDDSGARDTYSYTFTFKPIEKDSGYYDLEFNIKGKRMDDDGKVVSAKETRLYKFMKGEYRNVN